MRLKSNHTIELKFRLCTVVFVVIIGTAAQAKDLLANSTASDLEHASIREDKHSLPTSQRGAYLYETHCQSCHGDRNGNSRTAGASPHNENGHSWHHPDVQLIDWVLNGKFGAQAMPFFKSDLTEQDVKAILVFIKRWWTPEQREIQQDISHRYQKALDKNKQRKDR